jgi:hypothetical protein
VANRALFALLALLLLGGCMGAISDLDLRGSSWLVEAEDPAARVTFNGGTIDIDTPAGLSLWQAEPLEGPVAIAFEAMAVAAAGPNDAVSDLNAFWMASDGPGARRPRSGAFGDYDDLRTYYVGIGGNRNTTTRFRRYIGVRGDRPLLPGHDLQRAADLLQPNRWTRIRLIADGGDIAVERDGRRIFTLADPEPYRRGWFAIRTTKSHLRIRNLRIERL